MNQYDHKNIEKKWQDFWEKEGVYKTEENSKKPKQYILDMFPYPSGAGLHVGHPRGYIGSDVLSRMRRMQGFNVLHPMGFDAFGLPAEQYAIQTGEHPSVITEKAIETYKKQLSIIGLSYDWSREVETIDPEYYKWTQWIFLKLFDSYFDEVEGKAKPISDLVQRFEKEDESWSAKTEKEKEDLLMSHRLAYEGYSEVNWCPELGTVLANDEIVDGPDGKPVSERGGFLVEKKNMRQMFLRITSYADRLLSGLETINWPDHIKEIQRNWIGKSEGAEIEFAFAKTPEHKIKVFTTRPETIFGATFIAVSAGYAKEWLKNDWNPSDEIKNYISKTLKENENADFKEKEKTGVYADFEVVNPATGENIPVWITNYVLDGVGTGAIMAVPAHDERDFEFAKKFGLEIKHVISPETGTPHENEEIRPSVVVVLHNPKNNKVLKIKWGKDFGDRRLFIGGGIENNEDLESSARREVLEESGYKNIKLKEISGKVFHHYYSAAKNSFRMTESTGVFFELLDEEMDDQKLDEHEKGKFSFEWVTVDESKNDQVDELHSFMHDYFLERKIYTGNGKLSNSAEFNGLTSEEVKSKITEFVGGKMVTKYKMRDAIFARQRYWGEPIPLKRDGDLIKPLSESELPLELPNVSSYKPAGNGESPLASVPEWKDAGYETNTMPGWAGSSWYFLRYMDPKNTKAFAGKDAVNYWQDVDVYVGGAEHATGHLLYSRFWHKVLKDLGYVPTEEPFKLLKNQGLILASDGRKMSKRWGNVVNPDEMVDRFGADSFRLYEMFIGPFEQYTSWNTDGLVGTRRFLERVIKYFNTWMEDYKDDMRDNPIENEKLYNSEFLDDKMDILINKTIKKITDDIENFRFNTSVSSLMIMLNDFLHKDINTGLTQSTPVTIPQMKKILQILAPFAPHMTEELWYELGEKSSIHKSDWPKVDESKLKDEKVKIAVQVNGKVRDEIEIAPDASEADAKEIALARPAVQDFIREEKIKKFIYVPGKIVNIVI